MNNTTQRSFLDDPIIKALLNLCDQRASRRMYTLLSVSEGSAGVDKRDYHFFEDIFGRDGRLVDTLISG